MDSLSKLRLVVRGLDAKFPSGRAPFRIVTRLCEEAGELASEVNRMEGAGRKREKHGPPDPGALAREAQDVMRCVVALLAHYDLFDAFEGSLDEAIARLAKDGWIEAPPCGESSPFVRGKA